jgi:hypothetical protein
MIYIGQTAWLKITYSYKGSRVDTFQTWADRASVHRDVIAMVYSRMELPLSITLNNTISRIR